MHADNRERLTAIVIFGALGYVLFGVPGMVGAALVIAVIFTVNL